MEQLTGQVQETTANVNRLTAQADADRVVMYEMLDQLVTVRDENKRILEYLFGQQRGNGHGEQPEP
jgi:hypothetical protein